MAIISDMQEEEVPPQQHQAAAAATGVGDVDLDVLAAVLERKGGALPFLQAAIDVARRRSDLFRDPSAVGKVTAMASAARAKVGAEERRVREAKRKAEEAEEAERVAAGKEKAAKAAAAAAAERMESSVVTEERAAKSSREKGNNTEVEQEGSKVRRRKIKILETKVRRAI